MALENNQMVHALSGWVDPGFIIPGNDGKSVTISADLSSMDSMLNYLKAEGYTDATLLSMTLNDLVYAVRIKQGLSMDQSGITTFSAPQVSKTV
jgi:hypothetical protein